MRSFFAALLACLFGLSVQAQTITAHHALHPTKPLALGGAAIIIGENLVTEVAFPDIAPNGPLPYELQGVTVDIDGVPCAIASVTPERIFFVVSGDLMPKKSFRGGASKQVYTLTLRTPLVVAQTEVRVERVSPEIVLRGSAINAPTSPVGSWGTSETPTSGGGIEPARPIQIAAGRGTTVNLSGVGLRNTITRPGATVTLKCASGVARELPAIVGAANGFIETGVDGIVFTITPDFAGGGQCFMTVTVEGKTTQTVRLMLQ